jgi:DNA helicase-2/ATP-dependent DNA helicase PcrA
MKHDHSDLNQEQRSAVLHTNGPALVLAGAGSGKTRVITYRLSRLLQEEKIPAFNLLGVTFTNKAAGAMKDRVTKLVGSSACKEMFLGTFHALCLRFLKAHAEKLGYRPGFTIYDSDDQLALVKEVLWDLKMDEKETRPWSVHSFVSAAKNELMTPEYYAEQANGFFMEKVAQVYPLYQAKLRQNNAMDFDDLLFNAVRLLEEFPDILAGYQERFRYVMVDEYQDINSAQYRLVNHLVAHHKNLYVVGDPDQSIYGWRGADIRNILRFESDFPGSKVFKLEQNYRSTQTIIQAAQAVIRNNAKRKEKDLVSFRELGEPVLYYQAEDDKQEADFVARTILERLGTQRDFNRFAVLYRTNAQSRVLEEACRRYRLPYVLIGGMTFYERREVKDLLAYLKVLINPQDSVSLRRIVNVPLRGIGSGTLEKLELAAKRDDISLLDEIFRAPSTGEYPPKAATAIAGFGALVQGLVEFSKIVKPTEAVRAVLERSGYLSTLENEGTQEGRMRVENLKELVNSVAYYETHTNEPTLEGYLDQVSLSSDADDKDDEGNRVTLMTMHNAKGLEFGEVFVTGLEEGLFPHANSMEEDKDVEEERRLCYVGMTRAMNRLVLSGSACRFVYGTAQWRSPSRFLAEIPKELMVAEGKAATIISTVSGLHEVAPAQDPADELKDPEWDDLPEKSPFAPGDTVRHPKFGKGLVIALEGSGSNLKVTVSFPHFGKKTLNAAMARLEKVS